MTIALQILQVLTQLGVAGGLIWLLWQTAPLVLQEWGAWRRLIENHLTQSTEVQAQLVDASKVLSGEVRRWAEIGANCEEVVSVQMRQRMRERQAAGREIGDAQD